MKAYKFILKFWKVKYSEKINGIVDVVKSVSSKKKAGTKMQKSIISNFKCCYKPKKVRKTLQPTQKLNKTKIELQSNENQCFSQSEIGFLTRNCHKDSSRSKTRIY